MAILAIDTCEALCSAAFLPEHGTPTAISDDIGRGHAEHLMGLLARLLEAAGAEFDDVQRVAVTTGPGSFTGLRVGLAVARGLALGLGVPVVGLSSLMVLAGTTGPGMDEGPVHVVMRGRGAEAFYQYWDKAGPLPLALGEPANMSWKAIEKRILEAPGHVVGSGVCDLEQRNASLKPRLHPASVDPVMLGEMAALVDPTEFIADPHYLRAADAVKAKPLLPFLFEKPTEPSA